MSNHKTDVHFPRSILYLFCSKQTSMGKLFQGHQIFMADYFLLFIFILDRLVTLFLKVTTYDLSVKVNVKIYSY